MKKLMNRKFAFLPLLVIALFFAGLGVSAQTSGGEGMTYEQYLETNPADPSFEEYMRLNVGRSNNVLDCRNVCGEECASHRTWYQYVVRDHCWW